MTCAELAVSNLQIAIGADTLIEYLHVAWTAHRLQTIRPMLFGVAKRIHARLKLVPMPAALPQRTREQLRRAYFAKPGAAHSTPHIFFNHAIQRPPARMPEHHAGSFVLLMEEVQLASQLPMIDIVHDALRFLIDLIKPKRRAVNAEGPDRFRRGLLKPHTQALAHAKSRRPA